MFLSHIIDPIVYGSESKILSDCKSLIHASSDIKCIRRKNNGFMDF